MYMDDIKTRRGLEAVLAFEGAALRTLPTDVPLENGPPGRLRLTQPVSWVMLGPMVGDRFKNMVMSQALCAPVSGAAGAEHLFPRWPIVWPVRCLSEVRLGQHVVKVAVK